MVYAFATEFPAYADRMRAIAMSFRMWMRTEHCDLELIK